MANEWYYSHDGERHGPVAIEKIKEMAAAGQLRRDDLVWQAGMADWAAAGAVPGLLPPASVPPPLSPANRAAPLPMGMEDVQNKKLVAGLCGILLGAFGVHKFILGMTTPAVIMLAVSLVSVGGSFICFPIVGYVAMHTIGLIEGIIYLTKTDQEFYDTYIVGKKEWF
jgi:TM2 domain-containing membrane protein YozV